MLKETQAIYPLYRQIWYTEMLTRPPCSLPIIFSAELSWSGSDGPDSWRKWWYFHVRKLSNGPWLLILDNFDWHESEFPLPGVVIEVSTSTKTPQRFNIWTWHNFPEEDSVQGDILACFHWYNHSDPGIILVSENPLGTTWSASRGRCKWYVRPVMDEDVTGCNSQILSEEQVFGYAAWRGS